MGVKKARKPKTMLVKDHVNSLNRLRYKMQGQLREAKWQIRDLVEEVSQVRHEHEMIRRRLPRYKNVKLNEEAFRALEKEVWELKEEIRRFDDIVASNIRKACLEDV